MNFLVLWGDTDGFDGTAGTQPRFTTVEHNLVREIGIYEKQSSFVFSAKSCQNTISSNVVFNGVSINAQSIQLDCLFPYATTRTPFFSVCLAHYRTLPC